MNRRHLHTLLWLRWRLSRNQWSRGGKLNAVLTTLFAFISLLMGLGGAAGGFLLGAVALRAEVWDVVLIVWDTALVLFSFFWILGVLSDIQRSESIDLNRMLHMPVSLRDLFVLNYLISHLSFSLILFVPAMVGLGLGLAWSRGWLMLAILPVVLAFVFMVTAWTYCLRGWLISLMVNQRRRRAIIMAVTTGFILLSQIPNLYFNVIQRPKHRPPPHPATTGTPTHPPRESHTPKRLQLPPAFLAAHGYVPPLWVGLSALGLAEQNLWPAAAVTAIASLVGALGLRRAYRGTLAFYQGEQNISLARTPSQPAPPPTAGPTRSLALVERRLPGLPDEVAALALAFFRAMTRAPEIKMALTANLAPLVILAAMVVGQRGQAPSELFRSFAATGAVAVAAFGVVQLLFNQFGFDRDGFRALVLLPVRRRHILYAKNLAVLPFCLAAGAVILALTTFFFSLPAMAVLAALFQLLALLLVLCTAGNFFSIFTPYRVAAGSLKPTKVPAKTSLVIVISHLLFPVLLAPAFAPPALGLATAWLRGWPAGLVNLFASILLLAVILVIYRFSLGRLGDFLQEREQTILQTLTREIE